MERKEAVMKGIIKTVRGEKHLIKFLKMTLVAVLIAVLYNISASPIQGCGSGDCCDQCCDDKNCKAEDGEICECYDEAGCSLYCTCECVDLDDRL